MSGRAPVAAGRPGRGRAARRDAGFALPAALWILVLVAALSAAFLTAARSQRRAVANAAESARARWAARAGFEHAAAALERRLDDAGASGGLGAAGDSLLRGGPLRVNGVSVHASLLDSRARVHLNRATRAELIGLLGALGIERGRAGRATAAILDWRDPDGRTRPGGAEARDYAALELPVRPRDAPFTSLQELKRVRGLGGLYARLLPYLTVTGDGRINVNSAPVPVLAVLPHLDVAAARAVAAARTDGPIESVYQVLRVLPDETARRIQGRVEAFGRRLAYGPRFGQLRVHARRAGSPVGVTLRAVIELQGGDDWRVVRTRED